MADYRLFVEIREGSRLVVTHIFHGQTEQEALHYYDSHKKTDQFLRECVEGGLYDGKVRCASRMYWEVT